jgi:trk system potassium uptake protein TrkH
VNGPARRPAQRTIRLARTPTEAVVLRPSIVHHRRPPPPITIVAGLAGLIAIGTVLLMLPIAQESGRETGFLTALFTATSAVCVTGLVVVDTQEHWSLFGEAVIMLLIFVGGLGFLTSSTLLLLLIGRRLTLRDRLLLQRGMGEGTLGTVLDLIRRVVIFALTVQVAGALLLGFYFLILERQPLGTGLWYGLFHAVSAFNNAGFDLLGGFRSLTGHKDQPYLVAVVAALVILGGISFAVVADLTQSRRFGRLTLDTKLVLLATAALLLVGTVMVLSMEIGNAETLGSLTGPDALLQAFFFSVSSRTAGFATLNVGDFREETLFFLLGLMFVGAAAGSTAGGIKVNTLAVLAAAIVSASKGRARVIAFGREIPAFVVMRALTVAALALGIVLNAALVLTITTTGRFLDVLFEATSAFGTVGLSTGVTPELTSVGRLIVIASMFVGRVGPLTLAFALTRREHVERLRYPEDTVRIG